MTETTTGQRTGTGGGQGTETGVGNPETGAGTIGMVTRTGGSADGREALVEGGRMGGGDGTITD